MKRMKLKVSNIITFWMNKFLWYILFRSDMVFFYTWSSVLKISLRFLFRPTVCLKLFQNRQWKNKCIWVLFQAPNRVFSLYSVSSLRKVHHHNVASVYMYSIGLLQWFQRSKTRILGTHGPRLDCQGSRRSIGSQRDTACIPSGARNTLWCPSTMPQLWVN